MAMAKPSRRVPAKSLKRRVGTRRPRKTLLVFCEGLTTEPLYLDALRRQPSVREVSAVDVRIEEHEGSAPLTLVRAAVAAKKRAIAEEGESTRSGVCSTWSGQRTTLACTKRCDSRTTMTSTSLSPTPVSSSGSFSTSETTRPGSTTTELDGSGGSATATRISAWTVPRTCLVAQTPPGGPGCSTSAMRRTARRSRTTTLHRACTGSSLR